MQPRTTRPKLASRFPVHVTTRLRKGLPALRKKATRAVLMEAFAKGCERVGFRLVHYSIQSNHLHLVVEAKDGVSLSRGMQGLLIRIARALNSLWGRKGKVFADRFGAVILRSPRQVRNVLVYVLHNARRHGILVAHKLDVFSSGPWFDGWKKSVKENGHGVIKRPVTAPRTWLLNRGWRRHGLVSLDEIPASAPP